MIYIVLLNILSSYIENLANKTSQPAISIKQNRFRPHTRRHPNTWKNPYGFSARGDEDVRGVSAGRGGKERKREKLRVFISAP